jgi:alanine racemase
MDLITVDVTDLPGDPEHLTLLGPRQGIDHLAEAAGTIGYEVLTSLGPATRAATPTEDPPRGPRTHGADTGRNRP